MAFWNKKTSGDDAADATSSQPPSTPPQNEPQPVSPAPPQAAPQAPATAQTDATAASDDGEGAAQASAVQPSAQSTQPAASDEAASHRSQATGTSARRGPPSLTTGLAQTLGKAVSILMFSKNYQDMTLQQLTRVILPVLVANQYVIVEAQSDEHEVTSPVGLLLWARVSDELDQAMIDNADRQPRLNGRQWYSGENYWIIETIGKPKIVQAMIQKMVSGPFKDKRFKFRTRNSDGSLDIEIFDPVAIEQSAPGEPPAV